MEIIQVSPVLISVRIHIIWRKNRVVNKNIQTALEDAGDAEKTCTLSKPYECQLVLMDETFNNIQLPSDIVPSICKEVLINGEKLTFYFVM